jgi:hypothetical protein
MLLAVGERLSRSTVFPLDLFYLSLGFCKHVRWLKWFSAPQLKIYEISGDRMNLSLYARFFNEYVIIGHYPAFLLASSRFPLITLMLITTTTTRLSAQSW